MQIFESVKTVSFNHIAYPRLKVVGCSHRKLYKAFLHNLSSLGMQFTYIFKKNSFPNRSLGRSERKFLIERADTQVCPYIHFSFLIISLFILISSHFTFYI